MATTPLVKFVFKVMHLSVPAIPQLGGYLGINRYLYMNFHSFIFNGKKFDTTQMFINW